MELTARVSGCQDTLSENNEAGCVVLVGRRPRVLLVDSRPAAAAHLAEALRREHIEVKVCSPEEMPAGADDLGPLRPGDPLQRAGGRAVGRADGVDRPLRARLSAAG